MSQQESRFLLPADAAWLALERADNPMTMTVLMRVEELTAERLWQFLDTYWLAWERFTCMPVRNTAGWWWEPDPTFELYHHIQIEPAALDEAQLKDWVSARLNQPLPDYRPRWKFWLLPNAAGGAALVLRLHHCYADGLALMGVFDRICTRSPQQPPVLYGARERSDPARWREAAESWLAALQEEGKVGGDTGNIESAIDQAGLGTGSVKERVQRLAHTSLKAVNEASQFLVEPEDSRTHLKAGLLGRRVCRWSAVVPLSDFREVAHRTGCTINDVLLTCVTGALRRCLEDQDTVLDELVLHAAVPVDIRKQLPEGVQPTPGMLGNYFGTVFVPLPVDGASPLERLYRVKHETRRLKKSWQPAIAWGLTGAAGFLPASWCEPLTDLFCSKASAVVSNVPGTAEPRYLAGCRITEQMFWVPQAGDIGLGISIVSYAGQVQFGVVADEAIMPDPDPFLSYCVEALAHFPTTGLAGP